MACFCSQRFTVQLFQHLGHVQSLVDGVDVCAVIGGRAGCGDGAVLDDLLLCYRCWASCWTALWTEVTL